jgi:hypothetical protein
MRFHSDTLTANQVREALRGEIRAKRVGGSVYFDVLTEHSSRSHARGLEIQLKAYDVADAPDTPKRRFANSGGYGASGDYAATYDEWGWLIAALYAIDPQMVAGAPRSPIYADAEHFDERTALTYNPAELLRAIEDYGDPYPYVEGAGAKSKKGYQVGRRGYGRSARATSWNVHRPRTADEVRAYARLVALSEVA